MRAALCSWSGGKDSCFALMKAVKLGYMPTILLNMLNENGLISRSHGIALDILKQQSEQMGLPLIAVSATWTDYEDTFIKTLNNIRIKRNIDSAIFGDIDIQQHRDWEEKVCAEAKLEAILPIWGSDRKALVAEMIENQIECMIVSCNKKMGIDYLGKIITLDLIKELELIGIDPCGENGEYHTLVVNCPLFKNRLLLPKFDFKIHGEYCFVNWNY